MKITNLKTRVANLELRADSEYAIRLAAWPELSALKTRVADLEERANGTASEWFKVTSAESLDARIRGLLPPAPKPSLASYAILIVMLLALVHAYDISRRVTALERSRPTASSILVKPICDSSKYLRVDTAGNITCVDLGGVTK
jgi:hypothetical protein